MRSILFLLAAIVFAAPAVSCDCVGTPSGDLPQFSIQQQPEYVQERIVERVVEPVCVQRQYVQRFSAGSSGGCYGSSGGSGGLNFRQRDRRGFSGYDERGVIERDRFSISGDNNLALALALREENNRDRLAALVALDRDEPRRGARVAFLRRPRVNNSLPGERRSLFLALR